MKLTNNIGCMSKSQIEDFASMVLREEGYRFKMKWTTAGDIMIKPLIFIDESHINEYPWQAKGAVLHEIAHIDTHPQDDRHGELFHTRLAELIEQFMGCESITYRKDFLKLPVEKRREILAVQAKNLADNMADSQAKEDSRMME